MLDNTIRVTTPENISFEYQVVGPFRRAGAYLLDVMMTVSGYLVFAFVTYLLFANVIDPFIRSMGWNSLAELLGGMLVGMLMVFYFIVYWFYGALMETWFNGQTLGKRWTGMRVLAVSGHSIDGVQATLRNFFSLLDSSPFISLAILLGAGTNDDFPMGQFALPTFLFGLIVISISSRFQRIGDLVAGTVVVNESGFSPPGLDSFQDPRIPQLAELIPANFVPSARLTKAIASFVGRRTTLMPQRANEIAKHVAEPLLEQFQLQKDTHYDLFLCALYYKIFTLTHEHRQTT